VFRLQLRLFGFVRDENTARPVTGASVRGVAPRRTAHTPRIDSRAWLHAQEGTGPAIVAKAP